MKTNRLLLLFWFIPAFLFAGYQAACGSPGVTAEEVNAGNPAFILEFPFEITSNKPWVQARINDSEPLWFILDTGSAQTSVIDYARASALGLNIENETETHIGAGEGVRVKTGQANGVDYNIHGEELYGQSSMVITLDHVAAAEGRTFDGTLGHNFLDRYVVEIDFPNEIIRLYHPETYQYTGTGRSIPFMFLDRLPVVQAIVSLPGRRSVMGNFVIDTGTRMAVLFNTPFTEMHNIRDSGMNLLEGTVGVGVGGEVKGLVGRIDGMQLGPFLVQEPIVVFSQDKSGVVASNAFDGIIGGGILRRCKVIFDYSRQMMILEPTTTSPRPFEYDMSGLFLIAKGADFKEFTVISVMDGSPAAEAGMQKGDIITAIDGSPANEFTLEQIRQLLKENGREVLIEVQRGEKRMQVSFHLRRLV